jgi:antirestriction protein ArdC
VAQLVASRIYASGRIRARSNILPSQFNMTLAVEERLCADLIAAMEAGLSPWRKPWRAEQGLHRNPISGAVYSGANPLVLELAMSLRGTDLPLWCGYGQAKARGWNPRKGSKAALILRPEIHKRVEVDENGESTEYVWTTYKAANVFNLSDLVGEDLTAVIDSEIDSQQDRPEPERLEAAEIVLRGWDVSPKFGGARAFYVPSTDTICLPSPERFESAAAFIATWCHEASHSTGHKSRLNRDLSGRMGSASYAREELVAELASFLICRRLEVDSCPENHASYLSSWIEILRESPKIILKVLSESRKAADLICPGA